MGSLTLTQAPAALIDASDQVLREQLSLAPDDTGKDQAVSAYCLAAAAHVEGYLRRRLLTQEVRLTLDGFCRGAVDLQVDPVQSVDEVRYVDGAGTQQVLDASRYRLVTNCTPAELHPAYGYSWPVPRLDRGVVEIDMTVGFGATAAAVPAEIVQAVRMLVVDWVDYPEGAAMDGKPALPFTVKTLLAKWRLWL